MKLSDLNTGEHGVIVKVQGHGGFRKRIIEMGFIKGEDVEVLLNAPLQDPVKYKLMDYEGSPTSSASMPPSRTSSANGVLRNRKKIKPR